MFAGTRTATRAPAWRNQNETKEPRDRGIATLRLYNSADFPFGWIYEEAVLGGYRPSGSGDPVIVTSGGPGREPQQFSLSPATSYARHLGALPPSLLARYEEARPGSPFFLRERRMQRLSEDEVKAIVFSLPVWYAAGASRPQPQTAAPAIPIGARMCRHSIFSTAAGNVAAIVSSERQLAQGSLFEQDQG